MKIFFRTNRKNNDSEKRTHEIAFKNEESSEPTVDAEVEPRRNKILKISKFFGPNFIAYAVESRAQTFKKVMSTPEAEM